MEVRGARVLVVGATGVIGGAIAAALAARGASLAVAGRDEARLARAAERFGGCPARRCEAYDLDGCAALGAWAAEGLSGLDGVVVTVGSAAFGKAARTPDAVAEHLATVNALAPMAVLRGALDVLGPGSAVGAVTGVVAERPQPGMADYSASKAMLSAWLDAVRREQRARTSVLDARLPHLDTGFAGRAVAGEPPRMPAGADLDAVVAAVVRGLETGAGVCRPGPGGRMLLDDREV
ncbi:SDR family NAD(P)-dependent oxidoreductase [Streptacidiphilus sp. ASG 303]|uniref:SDR family NAD(P)-dependent oxidoreductase n=1 Tax=Streptacidiphilus sp. ASG 303 TaxID=2896847 RepID=UPI001E383C69|nr:SDR family NAD(P)-dependent oxidoreductase [Streptacidiphilus sp. ASG 303]MCD0480863.1 SDR family NAD(P)-dependent oxidoreductase [Streptacidiphilus sp. ASG 303]